MLYREISDNFVSELQEVRGLISDLCYCYSSTCCSTGAVFLGRRTTGPVRPVRVIAADRNAKRGAIRLLVCMCIVFSCRKIGSVAIFIRFAGRLVQSIRKSRPASAADRHGN